MLGLHQQHRIDTAVVLAVVGDLGVAAPGDLAAGGDQPELGHVDLDDGALAQDAQLRVQRLLRVLLDADDGQLQGDAQLGMCHVGLLVSTGAT